MMITEKFKVSLNKYIRGLYWLVIAVVLASSLTACSSTKNEADALAPVELKLGEGWKNPLGYYEAEPRFSWKMNQESDAKSQSAYQLQVTKNPNAESQGEWSSASLFWDSGKVTSDKNSWIRYQGLPLKSRDLVFWRVRIWDENNRASKWSTPQQFELGLLENADWQAKWIGHPDTSLDKKPSQKVLAIPQYLRTEFTLDKNIKSARLYITAKGLFKAYVNGAEVSSEDVMTPGWTPYAKRIESLTYDVTSLVNEGNNAIGASLAGGWFAGRAFDQFDTDHTKPARLLAQLEVTYSDGTVAIVPTNNSWQASLSGPIRFASIYDGERYDQSMEMPGWADVNFDSSQWQSTITEPLNSAVAIEPKRHAPIRITEQMAVVNIVSQNQDTVVFDFGQNMVGVPKISLPVIANKEVRIRFAEALHKGEFYTDNYRSAKSTNYFMPSETGNIEYNPTFTYHGYRYIEITGFDESKAPSKDWATALVQHSDIELRASFQSSHDKLNKLSENIVWGMRSNFFDIPLDCPQRDERLGWTGDAQVFATPSMYMADVYGFWAAWLQSIREEQGKDGKIPLYIPFVQWKINWTSSGWGDAVTIIPWELYIATGDETILADNYDMMKGWVSYHQSQSKNNISTMMTFGDWLQPHPVSLKEGDNGNRGNTDFNLIGTAYFARSLELTINAAKVLNKQQDVAELTPLYNQVKSAFNQHFFDENLNLKQGIETQTTYLLGLEYKLFPEQKQTLAMNKLIGLIDDADQHLRTGFLGTPLLANVLQEAGRSDLVYELVFKETYPSWFYSVNNGATTTWERWNSYSLEDGFNPEGMNSLNHYAYGSISRWFYEGILGIKPLTPGFKHFKVEPQLGKPLDKAQGGYQTPQGEIFVLWQVVEQTLTLDVTVPKNSMADIVLPEFVEQSLTLNDKKVAEQGLSSLSSGQYQIRLQLK